MKFNDRIKELEGQIGKGTKIYVLEEKEGVYRHFIEPDKETYTREDVERLKAEKGNMVWVVSWDWDLDLDWDWDWDNTEGE